MKATIKRIEQTVYYDLSGRIIKHMTEWKIYYTSGTVKTIKGHGFEHMNKTQRTWYTKHDLQTIFTGFFGESATTRTRVYY